MRHRARLLIVGLVVGSFTLGAAGATSAQELAPVPATEDLFISAGCPPDATGTCTSTRWLGKEPGDATSNYLTSITPVDEVFYQADGSLNWRDYASDDTLRVEGYPLRANAPINATVALSANAAGIAVNSTVHARVEAVTADNQSITFGPLEQTVTILPGATEQVSFKFEIPPELDGKVVKVLTFWMALHGVNAQGGYIDQEGGSTVKLPYWEVTAA